MGGVEEHPCNDRGHNNDLKKMRLQPRNSSDKELLIMISSARGEMKISMQLSGISPTLQSKSYRDNLV